MGNMSNSARMPVYTRAVGIVLDGGGAGGDHASLPSILDSTFSTY